jgi:SAM-dependent methyltransferase
MDQPGLPPEQHARALAGLARINRLSASARLLWGPLADLARTLRARDPGCNLRVLDLASGAGDLPLALWRRARASGWQWEVAGCDVSPLAVEHARERAHAVGADLSFFVHDALEGPLPSDHDAVVCSLFLHHQSEEGAVDLLRRMGEAARHLVVVNDLARGWVGFVLAHVASRLLTTSHVVHVDGPRSVEAAFTPAEALSLAERAGLHGARVARRWPCRWLLTWRRP